MCSSDLVELKKDMNVNEALQVIRDEGIMKETIYTCYVTDEYKKLIGCVSLRKLVTSKTNAKIQEIMESDIISVTTVYYQRNYMLCIFLIFAVHIGKSYGTT